MISSGNTTVLVTFNKPMSDGAIQIEHYQIVQETFRRESGRLIVTAAQFMTNFRTTVKLTTLEQNELAYVLTVSNMEDMNGNQIAPKELLVDPASVSFRGTGRSSFGALPGEESPADTDGDGLTDVQEQRGWRVLIELSTRRGQHSDREIIPRDVTSDPFVADTDGDGLSDALERQLGTDPRNPDTDGDQILDEREFNLHFTNPLDQDSDDDDLDDYLEIMIFRTSPLMADSDGDGLDDAEELFDRNRDPLLADLPLPQITVGEFTLALDITSSFTDEEGVTTTITDSASSTFSQSASQQLGTSVTNSTESALTFGTSIGGEVGSTGWKVSAQANFSESSSQGYSSTTSSQSSQTSQQQYQNTITNALEQSQSRSVTRTIDDAIAQATVNISNNSDIAFTIENLELSMLQQDRSPEGTFLPIATLAATGTDRFNIAPHEQNRGPLIFESTTVFPNRVEDLMREPTGLIFKVVNFDILDEFGRNLVFIAQEVVDRTVSITIDFGDGVVEIYRVSTASNFDAFGRPLGITMRRALEIAGIFKHGELTPDEVFPTESNSYETEEVVVDGEVNTVLRRIRGLANAADRAGGFWTQCC